MGHMTLSGLNVPAGILFKIINPSLYALIGDGIKSFEHEADGGDHVIGACKVFYRFF